MSQQGSMPEGMKPQSPTEKQRYEIVLGQPTPKAARPGMPSYAKPPQQSPPPAKAPMTGDSGLRETVETVVFVVVLVLLLKTFLAEAFVIPTGSMATTLLGYHIEVVCDKCAYSYRFNASSLAEPTGRTDRIDGSWCENCQAYNPLRRDGQGGGGP